MIDGFTVAVYAAALLRKLASPLYLAAIILAPTGSEDDLNAATPCASPTVPRSIPVVASKKSTLPVGVPEPGGSATSFAVNVTARPNDDGFADDVN